MTELEIHEYRDYDQFAEDWKDDDVATQQVWQLLGQLDDDELVVQLPNTTSAVGSAPQSSLETLEVIWPKSTAGYGIQSWQFDDFSIQFGPRSRRGPTARRGRVPPIRGGWHSPT